MNVYIYISNNRHLLTTPLSPTETHFLDLIKGNQCTLDYFSQWFNRNRGKNLVNDILNLIEYKEIPNELIGENINVNVLKLLKRFMILSNFELQKHVSNSGSLL